MMIHEITESAGRHKRRKRVGRGVGSGHGKTAGRGHKGYGSRSGNSNPHEGGQTKYYRRFPKRGFSNAAFRTVYQPVNLNTLDARFQDGETVDLEAMAKAGVIKSTKDPVKLLAFGEITKKLTIHVDAASATAIQKVEAAGGTVTDGEAKRGSSTKKQRKGGTHRSANKQPSVSESVAQPPEAKADDAAG